MAATKKVNPECAGHPQGHTRSGVGRNRSLNKPFKTAVKVDMLGGMAKFTVATK